MKSFPLLASLMLMMLALGPGCAKDQAPQARPPKIGPKFTFTVVPGDSLASFEFQVDLVLVNPSTRPEIESVNVDDYFKPDSRTRTMPHILQSYNVKAADRGPRAVTLDEKERFPNYSDFVVMANFAYEVRPGEKDPRRIFIPLEGAKWRRDVHEVTITLNRGGISVDPGWSQ